MDEHYDPRAITDLSTKMYVREGGFLDDIISFDADYFGVSAIEV